MPVRKVGDNCYQWGNQKVYCGVGAYQKAMKQGTAIHLTGWREAETDESNEKLLEIRDMSKEELNDWPIDFSFLSSSYGKDSSDYTKSNKPLFLLNNRFFIHKRKARLNDWGEEKTNAPEVWAVWDLEKRKYINWNLSGGPLTNYYFDKAESPYYYDYLTYDDLMKQMEYKIEREQRDIEKLWRNWESDNENVKRRVDAVFLMTQAEAQHLRSRMTQEEREMNSHPNRSRNWIPNRIRQEATAEIMADLPCNKCGFKHFSSLEQAKRHKHFCKKYGVQPENGHFFSPMALELIRLGILGDSLDNKNNNE